MKIEFTTKSYNISERLRDIVSKKIEKLDRYFYDNASATVICKFENGIYKMEISIRDGKTLFRSEVSSDNMYENIDLALPKVEKQIYKNREKLKDRKKIKNSAFNEDEFLFLSDEPKDVKSKIEKTKKFELEPLTTDDALMMLDSTDHDFYIYLNAENGKVEMVYRRKNINGGFGLIQLDY